MARELAADAVEVHDRAVGTVLSALVGLDGGERMRDVLALPGPLGGCLVRRARDCHDVALTASWVSHEPTCRAFPALLGRPLGEMAGAADVAAAIGRIATEHNVLVDTGSATATVSVAGRTALDSSP